MKRRVMRAAFVLAFLAMITVLAAPAAEAGRRRHYRPKYVAPAYHAHRVHRHYHGAYGVHVRVAPVVVRVPVVRPHGYYGGPGVYVHGYLW